MRRHFALFLLLLATAAHAQLRPFVDVGATRFQGHGDGVWYQLAFPTELRLTSPTLRVGVRNTNWTFNYTFLGCASARSLAVSDENYDPAAHRVKDRSEPPIMFDSRGCVHGLEAQYTLWRFGATYVNVGAMLYRPTYTVDVGAPPYGWHPWQDWTPRERFTVTHKPRLELTPSLAIGVDAPPWSTQLTAYLRVTGTGDLFPPLYHGQAYTLSIRYTFDGAP